MFREIEKPAGNASTDFTNMVMFCRIASDPIQFRLPEEADYLGSQTRRQALLPEHEVPRDFFNASGEVIRKEGVRRLARTQLDGALGHWKVMRTVLPSKVWETW